MKALGTVDSEGKFYYNLCVDGTRESKQLNDMIVQQKPWLCGSKQAWSGLELNKMCIVSFC